MTTNIYGSTGLGAAGTGETSFGTVPGRRLPPDIQAALQQLLSARSASSQPAAPAAVPQIQGAPMSSYIGAGAPGVTPMSMSGGQIMPQAQQPPNQQVLAQPGQQVAGAPYSALQIMQLLQHLRRSQPQTGSKK